MHYFLLQQYSLSPVTKKKLIAFIFYIIWNIELLNNTVIIEYITMNILFSKVTFKKCIVHLLKTLLFYLLCSIYSSFEGTYERVKIKL